MAEDEVASLQRAARLPISEIESPAQYLPAIHRQMLERYGTFLQPYLSSTHRRTHHQLGTATAETLPLGEPSIDNNEDASESPPWPQPIPSTLRDRCIGDFADRTALALAETCAVCGRRTFNHDVLFTVRHLTCRRVPAASIDLDILTVVDPHLLARPSHHFKYGDPKLDGLALHRDGVHIEGGVAELDICGDCHSAVTANPPKLPSLALANDNIRGHLPDHLQDVTWLEERLCAKYLASAYIVRLYDLTAPGAEDERQRVMKGHACSFPLNTVSTAAKLPWAVDGNAALLSCIVIGPRKPRVQDLRNVFKIRRNKVQDLLLYLREHCKGYPQFSLDENALNSLPDDDVPELIMRHVVYQSHNEVPSLFAKETAGLDVHPAELEDDEGEDPHARTFLEHHGLLDINGISVPAHARTASALANATGTERPDLIIRHGSTFVEDYNNPDLFPGIHCSPGARVGLSRKHDERPSPSGIRQNTSWTSPNPFSGDIGPTSSLSPISNNVAPFTLDHV
ncbi:hypothetical protein CF326_g1708 [Tilletia indica]|nr:hypothetical protein CF326_g1708 [Tilletia indica]